MKHYLLLFSIFSLFVFSCDKTELKKMEDDISYRKHIPFLVLSPADSVGEISNFQCTKAFPFPSDSTVSIEMDFDQDGQNDYRFTYTTNYELMSTIDSCQNYSSIIEVKGLGSGNKILIEDKPAGNLQVFEQNDKIPKASKLANEAVVFLDGFNGTGNVDLENGNKFIGVKLSSGGFGWIKFFHSKDSISFSIMEHAYNRNIHMKIKAGQTQ